ncbi:MAG: DUF1735 domain-containing protein [Bacteroidales bacterium]|nr:DUF1735 domain-containing protein [Bacteroidales bacterium]
MKKITILAVSAVLLASCYDPYVKDYDTSGIYVAYQYDLRSLVVGEGMSFKFGTVLGGVIDNTVDRKVSFAVDDALLTGSLEAYGGTTAFEGLMTSPSQTYVSSAIEKAGITKVLPLPGNMYSLSSDGEMTIAKGSHTASVTFTADSLALLSDPAVGAAPKYAFAWKITSADADTVLLYKSFQVIALRLENLFFGNWYHGGESWQIDDATGMEVPSSRVVYPTSIPSAGGTSAVYALTTRDAYSCKTDYFHNSAGSLTVSLVGKGVSVSGAGVTDLGSSWNDAKLLQGRKIYLNYKYSSGGGRSTVVCDTLSFRNRERDGVNEWQDADKEHYK